MKAGRELDALIAEKVFGLKIKWEHYAAGNRPMIDEDDVSLYMTPRYSTQIADAKLVWVKMLTEGYALSIEHDCIAWSVCFTHLDTGKVFYGDWRQSLEAQTCNVALKAVE